MKALLADLKADGDDARQATPRHTSALPPIVDSHSQPSPVLVQITALNELCNLLSMATEESLIAFRQPTPALQQKAVPL